MSDEKFFYNLSTGQVEKGKVSGWRSRMGPYETREEAEAALAQAQQRNESWAQDDAQWEES